MKSPVVRDLSEDQPALIHWMWTCAPLQETSGEQADTVVRGQTEGERKRHSTSPGNRAHTSEDVMSWDLWQIVLLEILA